MINFSELKFKDHMEKTFLERMNLHQSLVKNNLLKMEGYLDLSLESLRNAGENHDQSKFIEPERTAYLWMTWMYYCKSTNTPFEYPNNIKDKVTQGWKHHISNNSHHPEAHKNENSMSTLDIVEMVCDWTAIHQEQNLDEGSCMSWAIENIDKKWQFSNEKKKFIFQTIQELNNRNQYI